MLQGRPLQPRQASEDAEEHAQLAAEQQQGSEGGNLTAGPFNVVRYSLAKLQKMLKSMFKYRPRSIQGGNLNAGLFNVARYNLAKLQKMLKSMLR
jgi:hypothetical protein